MDLLNSAMYKKISCDPTHTTEKKGNNCLRESSMPEKPEIVKLAALPMKLYELMKFTNQM